MIVVIQCAARKREDAGCLQTREGRRVIFVGDPLAAPECAGHLYARPDDPSDQGGSWRDVLLRYNETPDGNPLRLLPAIDLYENETYRTLAQKFGKQKVRVLSAGWGLISASFLTPSYDITFTPSAYHWKRRRRNDVYADFRQLSGDPNEKILFLGGKDYLPLFLQLTASTHSPRTVLYNSSTRPDTPGCDTVRFETRTRTNWHYECAAALVLGELAI